MLSVTSMWVKVWYGVDEPVCSQYQGAVYLQSFATGVRDILVCICLRLVTHTSVWSPNVLNRRRRRLAPIALLPWF